MPPSWPHCRFAGFCCLSVLVQGPLPWTGCSWSEIERKPYFFLLWSQKWYSLGKVVPRYTAAESWCSTKIDNKPMQNSSPSLILCTRVSIDGCTTLCSVFKVLQSSCCNIAKDLILSSATVVLIRSISCSFTLHTAAGNNTESEITRQMEEKVRQLQHCGVHAGDSSI